MSRQHEIIEAAILYEIEHGTQRSAGALYGIGIIGLPRDGSDHWTRINCAIKERWPGKDGGWKALDRVKKIGFDVARATEARQP